MLTNKRVAVVTGASGGIGKAIVHRLFADGHFVLGLDLSDTIIQMMEDCGGDYEMVDISNPGAVESSFNRIVSKYNSIDILVNNASIVNNISATAKMDVEKWQQEINVNLNGTFYCTKFALVKMKEQGFGRVINMSSIAALGGLDRQPGYAASKAGIIGLTKNVALEYGEFGITSNAILPGLIHTENVNKMPEMIKEGVLRLTPAKRLGLPEEIASLVSFLASDEASFINGACIPVDGGASLNPLTLARMR